MPNAQDLVTPQPKGEKLLWNGDRTGTGTEKPLTMALEDDPLLDTIWRLADWSQVLRERICFI